MSRIGLLSVYNHNYGSILQAYALQTVLRKLGYDTEIIVYKKTNLLKQIKRLFYFPLLKATVKMKWKYLYCKLFQKKMYEEILQRREECFAKFVEENLYFSKQYIGRDKLIEGTCRYDGFVLGSDQVWNPMNLGGDFYTMTFIPDNKPKITYAPSFGVSTIPPAQIDIYREYLKRIDYISVRESDGVKIVKEIANRDVSMVVDPTILLERDVWDEIKGDRIVSEDYIFCYFISSFTQYRRFARALSTKTGLKIIAIPHVDEYVKSDNSFSDIAINNVGPIEFVNLISNAKYVCTDSFHGSVFSTLYERNFFVFSRYVGDSEDSTNSRLYSFLKMIGMEDRLIKSDTSVANVDLGSLDFSNTKDRLAAQRKLSLDYLIKALQSIPNE